MPWIAPELRENQGEIEAAEAGRLPRLVELQDLQGDLHVHTNASDGHQRLEQMVEAARDRGLKYLAITDHNQRIRVAHGLTPQRLLQQIETIDALNDRLNGVGQARRGWLEQADVLNTRSVAQVRKLLQKTL
jgi:DNA polymerase (family 10)